MRNHLILIVLVLVAACATLESPPTSTPFPPTEPPPPRDLPITPTQRSEDDIIEYGLVTFDGNKCTVSGPDEVPTGKYNFVLNDITGEKRARIMVARLEEGKTFQDLANIFQDLSNIQSEPGKQISPITWISIPFNFTVDRIVYTFYLDTPGEHAIEVGSYVPHNLWLCAPLQVVKVPSE